MPAARPCLPPCTVLAAVLFTFACSSSVVVQTDFPEPLVEPLPLTVGLRYLPEFTEYQYAEELPNDFDWSFDIGAANRALFDTIFGQMFARVVPLSAEDPVPAGVDLLIVPRVDALEFSLPRQSRSNQYAVWIRYNLQLLKPDGSLITDWPIAAYGQNDSRRFGGAASMAAATRRAMRDAAAQIAAGLADKAKVESLPSGASAATAEVAEADADREPRADELSTDEESDNEADNDAS